MQTGQLRLKARNIVVRTVNELPAVARELREVDACVCLCDSATGMSSGRTVWAASIHSAPLEIAWEWAEVRPGLLVLRDPMAIQSNMLILDACGQALARSQRMVHLNNLVYELDWRRATQLHKTRRRAAFAEAAH